MYFIVTNKNIVIEIEIEIEYIKSNNLLVTGDKDSLQTIEGNNDTEFSFP